MEHQTYNPLGCRDGAGIMAVWLFSFWGSGIPAKRIPISNRND